MTFPLEQDFFDEIIAPALGRPPRGGTLAQTGRGHRLARPAGASRADPRPGEQGRAQRTWMNAGSHEPRGVKRSPAALGFRSGTTGRLRWKARLPLLAG